MGKRRIKTRIASQPSKLQTLNSRSGWKRNRISFWFCCLFPLFLVSAIYFLHFFFLEVCLVFWSCLYASFSYLTEFLECSFIVFHLISVYLFLLVFFCNLLLILFCFLLYFFALRLVTDSQFPCSILHIHVVDGFLYCGEKKKFKITLFWFWNELVSLKPVEIFLNGSSYIWMKAIRITI